jgi:hypothetical protein
MAKSADRWVQKTTPRKVDGYVDKSSIPQTPVHDSSSIRVERETVCVSQEREREKINRLSPDNMYTVFHHEREVVVMEDGVHIVWTQSVYLLSLSLLTHTHLSLALFLFLFLNLSSLSLSLDSHTPLSRSLSLSLSQLRNNGQA